MLLILIYLLFWSELGRDNQHLNSKITTSPPMLTIDSSSAINHSDFETSDIRDTIFDAQDREFLSVLEDLVDRDDLFHSQSKNIKVTSEGRISAYFYLKPLFLD